MTLPEPPYPAAWIHLVRDALDVIARWDAGDVRGLDRAIVRLNDAVGDTPHDLLVQARDVDVDATVNADP